MWEGREEEGERGEGEEGGEGGGGTVDLLVCDGEEGG